MKRIGVGILALGLSLSALTLGSKAASAAEPCEPAPVQHYAAPTYVQPSAWYGYYRYESPRARQIRLERQRELARRRWLWEHRYDRYNRW